MMSALLLGVLGGILANEFGGWSTVFAKYLVIRAAKKHFPEPFRQRYEDEWVSHIEGMTTGPKFLQLWAALGIYFKAAPNLGKTHYKPKALPRMLRINQRLKELFSFVTIPETIIIVLSTILVVLNRNDLPTFIIVMSLLSVIAFVLGGFLQLISFRIMKMIAGELESKFRDLREKPLDQHGKTDRN